MICDSVALSEDDLPPAGVDDPVDCRAAHSDCCCETRSQIDPSQYFPSHCSGSDHDLAPVVLRFTQKLFALGSNQDSAACLGSSLPLAFDPRTAKSATIPRDGCALADVLEDVVSLFEGAPNWGSPLVMCNAIPQANSAAMIASMLSQVFSANIVDGEYAWNVHRAELETAGMIGDLFDWDPLQTGAIYTFGGSGCWMYGLKYGLARVLIESRSRGVSSDAKVLCSQQAHFVQNTASDWLGIGTDNVIQINVTEDNSMDMRHLEDVIRSLTEQGIPIAVVVATLGTTDAGAFDSLKGISEILSRYPNRAPFGKAVLYADAVLGWSWAYFKDYDFSSNPLNFAERILPFLQKNGQIAEQLNHADAVGVDFHKLGWAPYVSSCFLYKNSVEFETLMDRGSQPYLQERTSYNPIRYTMEVSRSASGSLAGWATLKFLGVAGMRCILAKILEVKLALRDLIDQQEDFVCVNELNSGFVTLFRVYSRGVKAKEQYQRENELATCQIELQRSNRLMRLVSDKLYDWYRQGVVIDGRRTPHIGFTSTFRRCRYNNDGSDPSAYVSAFKAFPMNVNVTADVMHEMVRCVRAALNDVAWPISADES